MKNYFLLLAFVALKATSQILPPSVTPTSAFINYGQNVTLTASGCAGKLV
jgi:aldose sugar dehydrogenase